MTSTLRPRLWLAAGALGVSARALWAQSGGEPAPLPGAGVSLLRVMGALALVIALFLAGVWLFRNWQRFTARRGVAPKLAVLEARPLGPRQSLYVVGYQNQRLLVAASPAGIALLTHLPDADDPASLNGHSNGHGSSGNGHGSFAEVLRRVAAIERALHRKR